MSFPISQWSPLNMEKKSIRYYGDGKQTRPALDKPCEFHTLDLNLHSK